ncbi:tetratricopeptide repeat protein [Paenibacillus lutrae]|uniref:Tetratricopeptide repeat protein n=1 Tax=Paenibacillus lutrae TaxID=2078573 RepID=A0A7X3FI30_9BACL|nr:tetratricopeptide repeat protein [Paenibacillus lutrae]MVP00003.1 hypothetical protein [Paenibacillus lutrae]
MFKHLFATMNDVLDDILRQLPSASGALRAELQQELQALKAISDDCIEQWLLFEEKLGLTLVFPDEPQPEPPAPLEHPVSAPAKEPVPVEGKSAQEFIRGQGYYKLLMYDQAIHEFEMLVNREPDFLLARAYLAMGYLRKGNTAESARHFSLLVDLTENAQMKALSYNAMGCIQFQNRNLEQALEYFKKAYHADPECLELLSATDD